MKPTPKERWIFLAQTVGIVAAHLVLLVIIAWIARGSGPAELP